MQFRSTGLLGSSILVHLNNKILPCFTWNLVQNLTLPVFLKATGSSQKMTKTKVVRKTPKGILQGLMAKIQVF